MLSQILELLLNAFFGIFIFLLLLRFYMQQIKISFQNPIGQFVCALTDWLVLRLRRVLPRFSKFDLATVLPLIIFQYVWLYLLLLLKGQVFSDVLGTVLIALLVLSIVELIRYFIYIVMFAIFIMVIISWINPYAPLAPLFNAMTRPFLRVFQRFIPAIGGIDLSPLFALLAAQILLIVISYVARFVAVISGMILIS